MLDHWDFAIGNVRIDVNLRRRRNDNGNRDGRNGRNVDVVRNFDNLRNDGYGGIIRNVRLRLEQHCFIVGANVDDAHNVGRRRSNGNSLGVYRDRQSWSQLRSRGTNGERSAVCTYGGTGTNDLSGCRFIFIYPDEPLPVPDRRNDERRKRLLKPSFTREPSSP